MMHLTFIMILTFSLTRTYLPEQLMYTVLAEVRGFDV